MTEEVSWVKWHFAKWRGDPALRMCGLASRGLWIDLLSYMHECEPYGHLLIAGKAPTARQIASLVGMTVEKEVSAALKELVENGVCSVTDCGVIYSRRMVRDKLARERGKQTGSLGGNPNITRQGNHETREGLTQRDARQDNPRDARHVNPEKRREEREEEPDSPPRPPAETRHTALAFDASFDAFWAAYPRKDDKGHARKAWKTALSKATPEAIMAALGRYQFSPERKFRPLASTWLHGERWSDEAAQDALGAAPPPAGLELLPPEFDPPDAYGLRPWVLAQPGVSVDTAEDGTRGYAINGIFVEDLAMKIGEACGGNLADRVDWSCLAAWCEAYLPPAATFLPTIRRVAASVGEPVRSMKLFDAAVRQTAGRRAA